MRAPLVGLGLGLTALLLSPTLTLAETAAAEPVAAIEAAAAAATAVEPSAAVARTEQIAATAQTPHEMVDLSTKALLEFVDEARPWAKDEPERYYREVEALLSPVVDFKNFARGVMATNYKKASTEQRERFRESFKWGLVKTYSLALTEFNDGKVEVLEPDREPDNPKRQRVKMEITAPSGDVFPVVYAVRQSKSKRWRIYNLVVNGVNMGLTFRSQFASAMKDRRYGGDLDQVIDAWASVVADADS
ncbi:MAG: phospholipid-binding protein MlaC [Pseudomonadales bacterium]